MAARRSRAELKVAHEMGLSRMLVACLRDIGGEMGDPSPGDPLQGQPDAVCDSPFGLLGIEVASGYYNDDAAKAVWDAAWAGSDVVCMPLRQNVLDLNATLADGLNRAMRKHWKRYSVPTYLVLDGTHAGLTGAADAPSLVPRLEVPGTGPFPAIYLALLDEPLDPWTGVRFVELFLGEPR